MARPRVFLDFSVNNEPIGRAIFELFNDTTPLTCENFRALCTGERGLSATGNPLYYKNSIIHRSIKDFMIQGGDFTKRNGSGGESIYGGVFADEDLSRPLDSEGLLCMANRGPGTNGSQFFITLRECPHLNGKHVVFGRIIRGYDDVVKRVAELPVDEKNRPLSSVLISNCGELELRKQPVKASDGKSEESSNNRRSRRSRSVSSGPGIEGRHSKKARKKKSDENPVVKKEKSQVPVEETEEEYDARLEREENERMQAERRNELQRVKEKYEKEMQHNNGVRFKGRGRMKYVDPEISRSQRREGSR